MKFNFTKGKNNSTALAIRMSISLVLALIIGITFILIRESLISNDKVEIWNTINSILSSSFLFLKLKEIKNIIYE